MLGVRSIEGTLLGVMSCRIFGLFLENCLKTQNSFNEILLTPITPEN